MNEIAYVLLNFLFISPIGQQQKAKRGRPCHGAPSRSSSTERFHASASGLNAFKVDVCTLVLDTGF